MNKDTENAIFSELKQYIPKTLTGTIVTIIIFLILNNLIKNFEWYVNFILALVIVAIFNEFRLFFKYRNGFKNKKTILILVNSRNINVFNQIKPELKESVEILVEKGKIENDVKFKFIDDYVYNQRMENIYTSKIMQWLYGYQVVSILSVNETTKNKRQCISVVPKIKIVEIFLGKKLLQNSYFVKEFAEEIISTLQLIDTENLFDDIRDLSSNVFLSISFIAALIYPIFDFSESKLEISKKIFNEAYLHCRRQSSISKRNRQTYSKLEEKFLDCKNITNITIVNELLDYENIKLRLERNQCSNIRNVLNTERIDILLEDITDKITYGSQYYSKKEIIEFFKQSPKIKILNIFDMHLKYLTRFSNKKEEWYIYYNNKAFIHLINNEFSEAFALYRKAIEVYEHVDNKEGIIRIASNIETFFEIVRSIDKNILYDLSNSINDIFMNDKVKEVENYTNLINTEKYALLPTLVRKEFESLRDFDLEFDKVKS